MLIRPNWPPVMNAVNGLIDCTTSPDSGSLKVGMGGSFLVSFATRAGVHRLGDCTCGRAACVAGSLRTTVIAGRDRPFHDASGKRREETNAHHHARGALRAAGLFRRPRAAVEGGAAQRWPPRREDHRATCRR